LDRVRYRRSDVGERGPRHGCQHAGVVDHGVHEDQRRERAAHAVEKPSEQHRETDDERDVDGERGPPVVRPGEDEQREVPDRPDDAQDDARDDRTEPGLEPGEQAPPPAELLLSAADERRHDDTPGEEREPGDECCGVEGDVAGGEDDGGDCRDSQRDGDRDRVPAYGDAEPQPSPEPRSEGSPRQPEADDCTERRAEPADEQEERRRRTVAASELLTVLLGLAIGYIAYRGYRRNDARPMLFVSLEFALALGVPALVAGAFLLVPAVSEPVAGVVTQVAELIGLGSILYGLRTD
jgi:hypothetical protein